MDVVKKHSMPYMFIIKCIKSSMSFDYKKITLIIFIAVTLKMTISLKRYKQMVTKEYVNIKY